MCSAQKPARSYDDVPARLLESFFELTNTPVALLDRQLRFVRVNPAYAQAAGRRAEEFPGRPYVQLHPHARDQKLLEGARCARTICHFAARPLDDSEGATYWDWTLVPLLDGAGEVEPLMLTMRDVTEQVRAEQKLRWSNAELQQRAAQLRRLALKLAQAEEHERRRLAESLHDNLQQLLVVAKLRADLLDGRVTDEGTREALRGLRELLAETIEASRAMAHELCPPILHEAGLPAALEWLARRMEHKHGLAVELTAEPLADPPRDDLRGFLFQATRELLLNVVKHARVRQAAVRLERTGEGGIRISVQDDGVGFVPEADTDGGEGGFGLLHIRERLEFLGGLLDVRSACGKGTRVRLTVGPGLEPRAALAVPLAATAEGLAADGLGPAAANVSADKIRVLLADDHEVMREGLAALLKEQPDVEIVAEASDGPTAVALAGQTRPDVIIMDVSMPGMSGVEATRLITAQWPGVRVVGLSMHDRADMANKMLHAGAVAYLSKGGPADQLLAELRKAAPAPHRPMPQA